jgi:hypothetical protein
MLKNYVVKPLFYIFLAGAYISLSPTYANSQSSSSGPYSNDIKPGVSDDSSNSEGSRNQQTGRNEIAQADSNEQEKYDSPGVRMGDWDYKENWRYHRKDFYKGELQPQVYREEHPYGPSGIGYDADESYNKRRVGTNQNNGNSNSPGYSRNNGQGQGNSNRAYGNNSYNNRSYDSNQENGNRAYGNNSSTNRPYSNPNQGNTNRSYGSGYSNNHSYYNTSEIGDNSNYGYDREGYRTDRSQ